MVGVLRSPAGVVRGAPPEHRGHVTVQDEAILIGQSFAVGGARYDVANPGIAQAREEFDVARASSLLH